MRSSSASAGAFTLVSPVDVEQLLRAAVRSTRDCPDVLIGTIDEAHFECFVEIALRREDVNALLSRRGRQLDLAAGEAPLELPRFVRAGLTSHDRLEVARLSRNAGIGGHPRGQEGAV